MDTRKVVEALDKIAGRLATSDHDEPLMLWVDEQRAIGERMILDHPNGPRCMGYAAFRDAYAECFERLFARVVDDLPPTELTKKRFDDVQPLLCDLVRALDPNRLRYDDKSIGREKTADPAP